MTRYRRWVALWLARAALADVGDGGGRTAAAVQARLAATLGENPPWLAAIAQHLALALAPGHTLPDAHVLADRIDALDPFAAALLREPVPRVRRLILRLPRMAPPPLGLEGSARPAWPSTADLADALGLTTDALAVFAGAAQRYREPGAGARAATHHYRHHVLAKAQGGPRLIEAPQPALKRIQRQLLRAALQQVPVHEAAHGFVPGRSAAGHAALHVGQPVVLRFDLADFFTSVQASRVHALWRTLGYPDAVCRVLTTLCTVRTPRGVLNGLDLDPARRQRLRCAHLPQGAPTSPALANLCAFRLDLRLDGLARAFGARYTRYADDLVFSGPPALREQLGSVRAWVASIAADEGFSLNPGKTLCMPAHRRQRVTGVVVNQRPNLARDDYDRLKAALHQAGLRASTGRPTAEQAAERARLLGLIGWVRQLHPARGEKLRAMFDRIAWAP